MIRPATSEDAEAVARVQVESWQAAYAHALPREQLMALSVEERAEGWRSRPPTFVAEVGGKIAGFVGVGKSRDKRNLNRFDHRTHQSRRLTRSVSRRRTDAGGDAASATARATRPFAHRALVGVRGLGPRTSPAKRPISTPSESAAFARMD